MKRSQLTMRSFCSWVFAVATVCFATALTDPQAIGQGDEKEKRSGGAKKGWIVDVRAGDISPSGKYVVLAYDHSRPRQFHAFLRLWDVAKAKPVITFGDYKDRVFFCKFLADEQHLVAVCEDGTVVMYKLTVQAETVIVDVVKRFTAHNEAAKAIVSANGKRLVTVGLDKGKKVTVKVWDLGRAALLQTLADHPILGLGSALATSPDGRYVSFAAHADLKDLNKWQLNLWDPKEAKLLRTFKPDDGWVGPISFSHDGKSFVLAKRTKGDAKAYDYSSWSLSPLQEQAVVNLATTVGSSGGVMNVPGRNIWFSRIYLDNVRDDSLRVRFWDFKAAKELRTVTLTPDKRAPKRPGSLHTIVLSPDGKYALAARGANDNRPFGISVFVWELSQGEILRWWNDPTGGE